MLMPSGRQTKRIMEKLSLLAGISKIFGLICGQSSPTGRFMRVISTSGFGSLK